MEITIRHIIIVRFQKVLKIWLDKKIDISTIVLMKIIADTNTFLAVTLYEPERAEIINLTLGHDLVAPEILPFEIGNALSAMLKRRRIEPENLLSVWDATQQIPVESLYIFRSPSKIFYGS